MPPERQMICVVDGQLLDAKRLIYKARQFGVGDYQSEYRLEFSISELIELVAVKVQAFVDECKADDERFSDSDLPEMGSIGYPSFDAMIARHRDFLAWLLKKYLFVDLLDVLASKTTREDWRFVIATVEEAGWRDDTLWFVGKGYSC